jgi:hypothetical protein
MTGSIFAENDDPTAIVMAESYDLLGSFPPIIIKSNKKN